MLCLQVHNTAFDKVDSTPGELDLEGACHGGEGVMEGEGEPGGGANHPLSAATLLWRLSGCEEARPIILQAAPSITHILLGVWLSCWTDAGVLGAGCGWMPSRPCPTCVECVVVLAQAQHSGVRTAM